MTPKQTTNFILPILLILFAFHYSFTFIDFSIPPFEDAAMIMRYSQHLANGHGIVWNIGESPVDGATDFLFMVASAALIKLGFTVGQAVRGIGFISHLLTILIIYFTNRKIHNGNKYLSFLSGLYFLFGTGLSYVSAYFGTPFFALASASTWALGLILMRQQNLNFWLILAFSLSGLITGLIRPEGVILACLMLLSIIIMRGLKNSASIIIIFGAVFLLLGGAYFLWRWDYFGYPLPNPFYKKGDGGWKWDTFWISLGNTLRLSFPVLFAFIYAFRSKETSKLAFVYLIPIIGFASAFGLISDEMNYGARFQYATVPIALMSWIPLIGNVGRDASSQDQKLMEQNQLQSQKRGDALSSSKGVNFILLITVAISLVYYSWYQNCHLALYQQSCDRPYERDGRLEMAKMLADYRDKGYVIATTEAGLLPYYSGWTAIDTWGLNDQFIAHNGKITVEYLDQYKPEIIMFHDYYSPLVPPKLTEANLAQPWFSMTILLKTYAEENNYVLAAVFGDSPYDTHYYYVRNDFEDSKRLITQISQFRNYYYPTTGKRSINYAEMQEP